MTPALCQVAISSIDLRRTHDWYRRALGFVSAGRLRHREVDGPAPVTGLPESSFDVFCLMGRDDDMQLELFEFQRPRMRRVPDDWRPSDFGYTAIGFSVIDFDQALERLRRTSGRPLRAVYGADGARRLCLRDPDGVLLELTEDDDRPRHGTGDPTVPVSVHFVSISVADLRRASRFWVDGAGFRELPVTTLHDAGHETIWGLDGARSERLVIDGGGCLIELVQYHTPPGRLRPAGYLLCDQGILNVALRCDTRDDVWLLYERLLSRGYSANGQPRTLDRMATVVYLHDGDGLSVELLNVEPSAADEMGFSRNTSIIASAV